MADTISPDSIKIDSPGAELSDESLATLAKLLVDSALKKIEDDSEEAAA